MAEVRMTAVFPAGATVELVQRRSDEEHVQGDVEASGVVQDDSTLSIGGLKPGTYWATCDGHSSVAVRAKDFPKRENAARDVGNPAGPDSDPGGGGVQAVDGPDEDGRWPAQKGEVPEVADDGDRTPKQTPQFRPAEVVTNAQPDRFVTGARTSANASPVTETDQPQTTTAIVPTSNRTPNPPADQPEARQLEEAPAEESGQSTGPTSEAAPAPDPDVEPDAPAADEPAEDEKPGKAKRAAKKLLG